jgi:hypothetical protein
VGHRVQTPWWEKAEDLTQMLNAQRSGAGYEGTDEYVPVGGDPYEIKQDAPWVTLNDTLLPSVQSSRIQIQQWDAESRSFTADLAQPGQLVLRLFNYPAWHVEVNARAVTTATRAVTGQMLIPLQAGQNLVRITFSRTWDRTVGAIISATTALFLGAFALFIRPKHRR